VTLVAVIVFFSLRILDLIENPARSEPLPEILLELPVEPISPPEIPGEPEDENTQSELSAARINAAGGLRMREGPSLDYNVVILIPNYEYITVLEENGGWAFVDHKGTSGWVSSDFLLREGDDRFLEDPQEHDITSGNRSSDPIPVRINTESGLRMRMGPGVKYHVVMVIPYNEVVLSHDDSDGWVYIEYLGFWGWVSDEFLIDE